MNRILVIEDDLNLLESISEFLTEEHYDVNQARNGEEGVEQALESPPDLILCDIYMPKMGGYEVFERLRNQPSTSVIPFIFITAKAEKEDILYGMQMGADDYIIKPIDLNDLLNRINKRLERTLKTVRRSELKFQAVFGTVQEAILLIRASDQSIQDVNLAACQMLGYTREELVGKRFHDLLIQGGVPASILQQDFWKPEEQNIRELEIKRPDHTVRWLMVTITPPFDINGKTKGIFVIFRDMTDRKVYEQQLIQAKEEAEESDKLKSSILSNISHELRTPLNGILGFSEILQEELGETKYKSMVENIQVSGRRLMTTLNSIITLSQLEAGKITLVFGTHDIVPSVKRIASAFQKQMEEKNISLELHLPEPVILNTDQLLFKQLFHQLFDNAVKFTHQGTITVDSMRMKSGGSEWHTIRIRDTGIGIDPRHFERIFQEFRQVSEGYDRKYQGSGLGLTISRKICNLLKGKITVESHQGEGSAFTIWLPVTVDLPAQGNEIPVAESATSTVMSREQSGPPRVLVVEDNVINKNLIGFFLGSRYSMDHAFDGESAIRLAEKNKYDIILMDINLGTGIDGLETTRRIRKIAGCATLPVVAVTGYTMIGDREKILAGGCTHYIAKPFSKNALLTLMQEALSGKI
jgi:PAS domain S-box-containing protein